MFEWFKKKENVKSQPKFKIIHYPISDKYMVSYKGYWLSKSDHQSGIISLEPDYLKMYCATFTSEEKALEHINKFKEQNGMRTFNIKEVE